MPPANGGVAVYDGKAWLDQTELVELQTKFSHGSFSEVNLLPLPNTYMHTGSISVQRVRFMCIEIFKFSFRYITLGLVMDRLPETRIFEGFSSFFTNFLDVFSK